METKLDHFINKLKKEVVYPESIDFMVTDADGDTFEIRLDRIESVGGTTIHFIES